MIIKIWIIIDPIIIEFYTFNNWGKISMGRRDKKSKHKKRDKEGHK